jgi:hypothetical protein
MTSFLAMQGAIRSTAAGGDFINTGDGTDRAVFAGNQADYSVTDFSGGKRVVNLTTFVDDRLFEIEFITSDDGTLIV